MCQNCFVQTSCISQYHGVLLQESGPIDEPMMQTTGQNNLSMESPEISLDPPQTKGEHTGGCLLSKVATLL